MKNSLFFNPEKIYEYINNESAFSIVASMSDYDKSIIDTIELSLPGNREEFEAALMDSDEIDYIGRVSAVKVDIEKRKLLLTLENGINVKLYPDKLVNKKDVKAREIIKEIKQSEIIYLNIVKTKSGLVVREFESIITPEADKQAILNYIQDNHINFWHLMFYAVGLNPDAKLLRLFLPRFISLFKIKIRPNENSAIHILQFTEPATGKTTFYSTLSLIKKIQIFSTFPSRAKLILNASTGALGVVFHREHVVIDAFDKNLDKTRFEEFMSYAETGLANGIWTVEKSSKVEGKEYRADTGFVFLGNVSEDIRKAITDYINEPNNDRDKVKRMLVDRGVPSSSANAFIDRLAIIDYNEDKTAIDDYIGEEMLKFEYTKALFSLLQERAKAYKPNLAKFSDIEKRRKNQAIKVAKALFALGFINVEDLAKALVLGIPDWYAYIKDSLVEKYEEQKESTRIDIDILEK